MTTTTDKYTTEDVGCYVDGVRGIYAGEMVQAIAQSHGWPGYPTNYTPADHDNCICNWEDNPELVRHDEDDHGLYYDECTDEATDYLNTLCDDTVAFTWETGDFMLVSVCADWL